MNSIANCTALSFMAFLLLCCAQIPGAETGRATYRRRDRQETLASNDTCVNIQVRSYHRSNTAVSLARCEALQGLQESSDTQLQELNDSVTAIGDTAATNQDRIAAAERRLDNLEDSRLLIIPTVNISNDVRRLCQVNSFLEVAELCRISIGVRIPDPFFFHIPCTDSALVAALGPSACPQTFWLLEPGCVKVNGDKTPLECLVEPDADAVCMDVVLISCSGYATGGLLDADDPGMMEMMMDG